jgi:PAS domain S-box-containing protein
VTAPEGGTPSGGWLVAAAVATITVFACDLLAPPGYAVPMFYTLPILLTRLIPELRSTTITAGSAVLLTWLGAVLNPIALAQHDSPNRAMATALLLGIAWLVITQKQSAQQIEMARRAKHESEERFRVFLANTSNLAFIKARNGSYLYVNRRFEETFQLEQQQVLGKTDSDLFPPEYASQYQRNDREVYDTERAIQFEEAALCEDGCHTSIVVKFPVRDRNGQVYGLGGIATDITDRKKAESELLQKQKELHVHQAQLQDLTEKLLTAQEQERKRIARDLHDDFTQRLAALTIDLQSKFVQSSQSGLSHALHLKQLGDKAERLTTDLQRLAHQLHPSLLEHAGLEAAAREYMEEFSTRTGLPTEMSVRNLPAPIPIEQATCLYRVLQESLENVRKHAEATNILVRLIGAESSVGITIIDDGCGFEPSHGLDKDGLGLTSMAERVKVLQGTFDVRTKRGEGTEIEAWVSLPNMTVEE